MYDYPTLEDGPYLLLDPNRLVERHFGIYENTLEPKRGRRLAWTTRRLLGVEVPWLEGRPISPVDVYRRALGADSAADSAADPATP